ncbi:MAG: class I SAM-dependent methyltransferase [Bryobacterales bacterium]|nr:class I SAM-dependent methyltransferase [Bryobacterales bacterium]
MAAYALFVAWHFPWDTDPVKAESGSRATQAFYNEAFDSEPASKPDAETNYERIARLAAEQYGVKGLVTDFVRANGLENKRVLEVGAGKGSLQDIVADYTGLDLSASARKHFHKPFVQASATNMPFRDGEFDAIWTVWVVEHIPNPEHAMMEIRRVVKDGGYVFFMPAWNCVWWAADGLEVRPYSELGVMGKVQKASLPLISSLWYTAAYRLPVIGMRSLAAMQGGPTRLRFERLKPNYEQYWQADSDAVIRLERTEAAMWFTSRGDECLNCGGGEGRKNPALILRIRKTKGA